MPGSHDVTPELAAANRLTLDGIVAKPGAIIEEQISRFRDAWQRGERPSLEDYLPDAPAARRDALVALVTLEMELRLAAGKAVSVEAYLERFAELNEPGVATGLFVTGFELKRRFCRVEPPAFRVSLADSPSDHADANDRTGDWQLNLSVGGDRPPDDGRHVSPTLGPAGSGPQVQDTSAPDIPGYVILDELGRGGMGVVYWARHNALQRTVALKLMIGGAQSGPEHRRRFQIEARAVAALDHPHIVRIYDVGEFAGIPYFALEFLPGGTLAKRLHQEEMTPKAAAAIVVKLARGVHAAHKAGIVHRDLKPENVLLDADGTPKVGDFGLAKRLDAGNNATQSGDVIGTPSYMAPEQAEGHARTIGPATDVYGLGAILYECLVGRPPFLGMTPVETLLQVLSADPVPPSRLRGGLPRDLEIITLKCLEKEAGRRYASAEALADDLERWLSDKPITARPAGRWERSVRWCRRNRLVAALTGAVAIAVVVGLIASWVLAAWALSASHEADLERQEAEQLAGREHDAKELAEKNRAQAEAAEERTYQAFEKMTDPEALAFLSTVQLSKEQKNFLKRAVGFFQEAAAKAGTDEKGQLRAAKAHLQLAQLFEKLGDKDAADGEYRATMAIRTQLIRDFPQSLDHRRALADAQAQFGNHLFSLGRKDEGLAAYREALATRYEIVKVFPPTGDTYFELALAHSDVGQHLQAMGQYEDALAAYRRETELLKQLVQELPKHSGLRHHLARSHMQIGELLHRMFRDPEAQLAFQEALAVQEQLAREFPGDRKGRKNLAGSYYNQAEQLRSLKQPEEAARFFRLSQATHEQLAREDPADADSRFWVTVCLRSLAAVVPPAEREACHRQSIALREQLVKDFPSVVQYRQAVANGYQEMGREFTDHASMLSAFRQEFAVREQLARDFPTDLGYRRELGRRYHEVADGFHKNRHYADALEFFNKGVPVLDAVLRQEPNEKDRYFLRECYLGRARCLTIFGSWPEAAKAWDTLLAFAEPPQRTAEMLASRRIATYIAGLMRDQTWPLLWGRPVLR